MYFRVVLIEYISVMFQISFAVSFNKIILSCSRFWLLLQAIDHIINSAAKSNYMSAGQISVPIVFRGPNGAAAGVGAQHSHVWLKRFLIHLSFCKHTYSLSQAAHFILSLSLSHLKVKCFELTLLKEQLCHCLGDSMPSTFLLHYKIFMSLAKLWEDSMFMSRVVIVTQFIKG